MAKHKDESLDLSAGYDPTANDDSVGARLEPLVLTCRDPNTRAVASKMVSRAEVGDKKYGVTTARKDIDMMGWLTHLQEELMDACVYIERLKNDKDLADRIEIVKGRPKAPPSTLRFESGGPGRKME